MVLTSSDKYHIASGEGGEFSLTVLNLDPATDGGDYQMVATNPRGTLKCTATLSVQGQFYIL